MQASKKDTGNSVKIAQETIQDLCDYVEFTKLVARLKTEGGVNEAHQTRFDLLEGISLKVKQLVAEFEGMTKEVKDNE